MYWDLKVPPRQKLVVLARLFFSLKILLGHGYNLLALILMNPWAGMLE
jgi:hypothetical protein